MKLFILSLMMILSREVSASTDHHPPVAKKINIAESQHYVLMQKPQDKSWQILQNELSLEITDLVSWQQQMAGRYALQLQEWLLVPDINASTHLYPEVDLVQIGSDEVLWIFAWRYQLSVAQLINLNQPLKTAIQLQDLRGQWVIVPTRKMNDESLAVTPRAEKLRQLLSGFWSPAAPQGAER